MPCSLRQIHQDWKQSVFRAKTLALSEEGMRVDLTHRHRAPEDLQARLPHREAGLYYLARSLSAQLSLVTEQTDYQGLEKCYSIWICRDDIPKQEQYSVSFYEIANTRNIGNCIAEKKDYDLIKLVVIRLGNKVYNGDAGR